MANIAYITPKVLRWARKTAKIDEKIAASKASVSVEKLRAWEKGISYPTIRQARVLAKAYKRPFALLFLPEIPDDFKPLQDFRRKGSKELSASSIFIIREIRQKQEWISEFNKENGTDSIRFVGRFSIDDDPSFIADDILNTLDVDPANYETENPLLDWIRKSERKGIFISRTGMIHTKLKLDPEEIQGFAIADKYAPFVFINSADWKSSRLYTLVHELAHIWIAKSGISNFVENSFETDSGYFPVEIFCNEVAANALMPERVMCDLEPKTFDNHTSVFKAAKRIGVSSLALLIRSGKLGIINRNKYLELKSEAEKGYRKFLIEKEENKLEKSEKGRPDYYLLRINRNSRLFTQTVLDEYRGGRLQPTEASSLLDVKVNKFPLLEAQMY